jgi:DNA-binding transcriptional LysR family regulator
MNNFANRLDWNLLHSFMVVAQEKSMTRAAHVLHRTQPAVSQAIRRLEDTTGVPLMERRKSGLVLTQAGQDLLDQIRPIYASISRMPLAFSQAPQAVSGKIRIAAIDQATYPKLERTIAAFFDQYPMVDLEMTTLTTAAILRSVALGTCTVGVSDGVVPTNLTAREVIRERFGLFCSGTHPLAGRKDVLASELRHEPFIAFTADVLGGQHMGDVTAYRAKTSIGQRVRGQSTYVNDVRRMIEHGLGIGFLPLHLAVPFQEAGVLWRLPPYSDEPTAPVFQITNPNLQLSKAEHLFLEMLNADTEDGEQTACV